MTDRPALYTPADLEGWRFRPGLWTERDIACLALSAGLEWVQLEVGSEPWTLAVVCRGNAASVDDARLALEHERPRGWLVTVTMT